MNPHPGRRRGFYPAAFTIITGGVLGLAAFLVLQPVWQPLAWALILAILLQPCQHWLEARLGGRPGIAAAMLTVLVMLFVLGPVSGLTAAFAAELAELAGAWQSSVPTSGTVPVPELQQVPVAGPSLEDLRKSLGVSRSSVREWMQDGVRSAAAAVGPLTRNFVLGAMSTAVSFVVMLVILFFCIRDGRGLAERANQLVPWRATEKRRLAEHMVHVLRALVIGSGITAALQGTLVGVAFAVLDLPAPVVFGALAAVLSVVPFGGTALVWGPAALYLYTQDRESAALGLIAFGSLLVGTVDNLLRPMLVAGRAEVGTPTIFIGAIGGIAAFGVIGLVLGPLVLCLAMAWLEQVNQAESTR